MTKSNGIFRQGVLLVYGCGIGCFVAGYVGVMFDGVFNYSTAASVGGQMVIPGMIAGTCGYTFYQLLKKRKFIAACLSNGLGFGLFCCLNSVLVQLPANVKQVPLVIEQPVVALISGFIGGFIGGIVLYMHLRKKRKAIN